MGCIWNRFLQWGNSSFAQSTLQKCQINYPISLLTTALPIAQALTVTDVNGASVAVVRDSISTTGFEATVIASGSGKVIGMQYLVVGY